VVRQNLLVEGHGEVARLAKWHGHSLSPKRNRARISRRLAEPRRGRHKGLKPLSKHGRSALPASQCHALLVHVGEQKVAMSVEAADVAHEAAADVASAAQDDEGATL